GWALARRHPMPGGGRHNQVRRQRMAELRQQGLTLAEVGRRLTISKQGVQQTLARRPRPLPCVCCCRCETHIPAGDGLPRFDGPTLCLSCLAGLPEATFGQRLRALRVAAGLAQLELARRAGTRQPLVGRYERDLVKPRPRALAGLRRVLGEGLTPPE